MKKSITTVRTLYGVLIVITFLFILLGEGTPTLWHVLGGDSEAYYIHFRHHLGVAPGYPLLIHLVELLVGNTYYLDVVAGIQMIFLTVAIIYLVYTLGTLLELKVWEIVFVWGFALLPFVILLPEDPIGHVIMTESLTYPIIYIFIAWLLNAAILKEEKKLFSSLVLAVIATLIRSQMMFLFAVWGICYFYILAYRFYHSDNNRIFSKQFLIRLAGGVVVVLLCMKSVGWMTTLYEKVFFDAPNVAYSDQLLVQHMLYLADEEDANLYEDEALREIFTETYKEMIERRSNYKYQPQGLTAWKYITGACGENSYILGDVIRDYLEESGELGADYVTGEVQVAQISRELAMPLLIVHWADRIKETFDLLPAGFVSTVLFHKESFYEVIHIVTLLFYVFGIVTGSHCWLRTKRKLASEMLLLVLGTSIINVVYCNILHFGLQRYLAYTLGLNWIGMFLVLRELVILFWTPKKNLENITLVAISSVHMYETVCALKYSMREISYNKVLLLSDHKPFYLPKNITFVKIERLKNVDDYSYFMVYELYKYIDTEYALIVHHDGFVVNPQLWREEFLNYDYIGSPWREPLPEENRYRDIEGAICRVGNGVSLRSKALMELPTKQQWEWKKIASGTYNEDCFICCDNKHLVEAAGLKIAPIDVAKYFGHEQMIPEIEGIEPFLFHQWRGKNKKYPRFINVFEKVRKKLANVCN